MLLVLTRKAVDTRVARVEQDSIETLVQDLKDYTRLALQTLHDNTFQSAYAEEVATALSKELLRRNMTDLLKQIKKEVR